VAKQKASNTYTCPACGNHLFPGELQRPGGVGGGTYCPKCQTRVYFSFPHPELVAILSLLLAIGGLSVMRVTSLLWFIAGTVVLWIPISMFLNIYSTRFKRAALKKWKPRTTRTFFEWLYERFLLVAQDIAHADRGYRPSCQSQCPGFYRWPVFR